MVLDSTELLTINSSSNQLAGIVILAGGNSKRMGSPKAMLTLPNGETLLDYHIKNAAPLNVPIMIADNERGFGVEKKLAAETKIDISHIADYVSFDKNTDSSKTSDIKAIDKTADKQSETGGALVAIESALQSLISLNEQRVEETIQSGYLMVISCDSLLKATELWQYLSASATANQQDKSVICLSDESHLYPLLGLYKLAIEPELRDYLDSSQRRVMRFVEPICQKASFDSQWQNLTNFNTPEDFEKACKALYK